MIDFFIFGELHNSQLNPLSSATQNDILSDDPITDIAYLSTGECFVTACAGLTHSIAVWSPAEDDPFELTSILKLHADPTKLCVLPQDRVVIGLVNGSIIVAECTPREIKVLGNVDRVHSQEVSAICGTDPQARHIITAGSDGSIVKIDVENGSKTVVSTSQSGVQSVCALQYGQMVASGHLAGQILVWDLRDDSKKAPAVIIPSERPMDAVTALDSHPGQANLLCFGSEHGSVGFVDVRSHSEMIVANFFDVAGGEITKVKFHPSLGENLFCSSDEGSVIHWDASRAHQYAFGTTSTGHRSASWISSNLQSTVKLNALVDKSAVPVTSFDVCGNSVLMAMGNQMIRSIDGLRLA